MARLGVNWRPMVRSPRLFRREYEQVGRAHCALHGREHRWWCRRTDAGEVEYYCVDCRLLPVEELSEDEKAAVRWKVWPDEMRVEAKRNRSRYRPRRSVRKHNERAGFANDFEWGPPGRTRPADPRTPPPAEPRVTGPRRGGRRAEEQRRAAQQRRAAPADLIELSELHEDAEWLCLRALAALDTPEAQDLAADIDAGQPLSRANAAALGRMLDEILGSYYAEDELGESTCEALGELRESLPGAG